MLLMMLLHVVKHWDSSGATTQVAAPVLLEMAEEVPEAPITVAEPEAPEEAPPVAEAESEAPEEAPLVAVAEPEAPEEALPVAVAEEAADEEAQVETAGGSVDRLHPKRAVNKTPEINWLTMGKRAPQSKQAEMESVRLARIVQTFRGLLVMLLMMLLHVVKHWDSSGATTQVAAPVLLEMAEEVPEAPVAVAEPETPEEAPPVAVAESEAPEEAVAVAESEADPELPVDEATEDAAESVPVDEEPSIVLVAELAELAALDERDVLDD
jgi:hypothetical protein